MTYNPAVPTGFVPLNQDYANVQANFNQINNQWLVDHVPLTTTSGTPPNGYHLYMHMVPFSTTVSNPTTNYPPVSPPATPGIGGAPGYGILWSPQSNDGIEPDEMLYFLTGGGRQMQLTRNFVPTANTNGATFLPGGIIMNWGYLVVTTPTTPSMPFVTLTQKFPNTFFNATIVSQTSNQVARVVSPPGGSNVTQIQFGVTGVGNYFWTALGN